MEGQLGQRGGDDGHGATPHRQVPVGPPAFLLRGTSNAPASRFCALDAKRLTARSAVPPEWAEVSSMAGKSPEFLKETPDFGGLLGQRGGDDGHGAAPHRQVPVGPPAFLLRGASKLPRHQGFAPLRKTLDGAECRAPGVGGGLLHGRKKSGAPEGNSGLWRAVRPARR